MAGLLCVRTIVIRRARTMRRRQHAVHVESFVFEEHLRPFRDFARNGWPLRGSSGPGVGGSSYGRWMADEFSQRYGDLLTGSYDCVDRIVLNAYFPLGHNPGGFRVWWRRWHDDSDEQLDNTHLMRMAGRFARRVKAWGAANEVPVIFCKRGERKHRIAEEYLATHEVGPGCFWCWWPKAPATVWKVQRSASGVIVNIEEVRVRQPLLVPHHGSAVGACDDQDVRAPAVRRADHPQRPRVRGLSGAGCRDRFHQGRQLLHRGRRPRTPGPDRRCLVAARDYRAAEPGLQPVDLHRVPVLRPGHRRAAAQRIRLRLLRLSGRVQPQPALRRRQEDAASVRHRGRPHPFPAGRAQAPHHVRREARPHHDRAGGPPGSQP